MYMPIIPLIKLWNLRKRKIHIACHCKPNGVYTCNLPQVCWKSAEMAWDKWCSAFH